MDNTLYIDDIPRRRLLLRAVEPADADCLYGVENDEEAWASSDTVAPYSMHALRRYAEACTADPFADGQLRLMAVCAGDPGVTAGILDFYEISPLHASAWTGIYIMPAMRGRGYGRELLELGISYAARRLHLANLGARILDSNAASLHLFTGCGFGLRGTLPAWRFADGRMQDLHLLTLPLQ